MALLSSVRVGSIAGSHHGEQTRRDFLTYGVHQKMVRRQVKKEK
jgi:hypothetical protein